MLTSARIYHYLKSDGVSGSRESYKYRQLRPTGLRNAIRLLELSPGQSTDEIQCVLKVVSLDTQPTYEAISYHWGNPDVRRTINVDGQPFRVTTNLFTGLHQLRSPTKARILWTDAICINQSDNEEKGEQILIMHKIYEQASQVVIWLGEADEYTTEAILLIQGLARASAMRPYMPGDSATKFFIEMDSSDLTFRGLPPLGSVAYAALTRMLNRPWFTRMWIIQELAVSKEAVIQCSGHQIAWDDFVSAINYALDIRLPIYYDNTGKLQKVALLHGARASFRNGMTQPLLGLLQLHREFNSSEERDKVYALLGLASDSGTGLLDIIPDTTKPAGEVYKDLAVKIMRLTGSLDILSIPRIPGKSKIKGLPSWVPDWSVCGFGVSLRATTPEGAYFLKFEAVPSNLKSVFELRDDDSMLKLKGHIVDVIDLIGKVHTHQAPNNIGWLGRFLRMPRESSVLDNWEVIAGLRTDSNVYTPTGESIVDAYWKTLVAGQMPNGLEQAQSAFAMWDTNVRQIVAHKPSSKYLRWLLHPFVFYYNTIKIGQKVTLGDVSTHEIMEFRDMMTVATERKLCRTESGYIGLAPQMARKGDSIALFEGGMVPLVVRDRGGHWEIIGDCYVHGIMTGERFRKEECQEFWVG